MGEQRWALDGVHTRWDRLFTVLMATTSPESVECRVQRSMFDQFVEYNGICASVCLYEDLLSIPGEDMVLLQGEAKVQCSLLI